MNDGELQISDCELTERDKSQKFYANHEGHEEHEEKKTGRKGISKSGQSRIREVLRDLPESRGIRNQPARVNCAILANRATHLPYSLLRVLRALRGKK
ncbi:MAG: hypothetical protein U0Z53_00345 [Blastocatellia bacterium]